MTCIYIVYDIITVDRNASYCQRDLFKEVLLEQFLNMILLKQRKRGISYKYTHIHTYT